MFATGDRIGLVLVADDVDYHATDALAGSITVDLGVSSLVPPILVTWLAFPVVRPTI